VRSLSSALQAPAAVAQALLDLTELSFEMSALDRLSLAVFNDPPLRAVLQSLRDLLAALEALGHGPRVHLDLGLVNDQGYYTGVMFKFVSERLGRVLGGGGRYDSLIGRFGPNTPAVGFSLSLEALLELLAPTLAVAPTDETRSEVVALGEDWVSGLGRAQAERQAGRPVVVSHE
jgi:ATP phosphoribosyltransferase regulatory subunit